MYFIIFNLWRGHALQKTYSNDFHMLMSYDKLYFEIISDNNTVLEVGSVITEIKYATRAYYLRDRNIKKEKADEMKMLLSNISLYVQDIDESFLYLNLETKFANAVYKIPHNGHMALSDYFIYYDNQIDEYGSYDYLASRVSKKIKIIPMNCMN